MCSLTMEISLSDLSRKFEKAYWAAGSYDPKWFEHEMKKGRDYLPGPVTVINFDYLEN